MPRLALNQRTLDSVDPLQGAREADLVVIVTDHSAYRYPEIVAAAQQVLDTRNATRGLSSAKILKL